MAIRESSSAITGRDASVTATNDWRKQTQTCNWDRTKSEFCQKVCFPSTNIRVNILRT
jgi:hypothetical protein